MFVSIVIPLKKINHYILNEVVPALEKQTVSSFELILVPDKKTKKIDFPSFVKVYPSWPKLGPADKRDLGVKKARGEIIAFIDDDAFPDANWLKNALSIFKTDKNIAGVCGPTITPDNDPLLSKVSGWMWASTLGSGGAGSYRCLPKKQRQVDDYPSCNLLVRKKDFQSVGGFDSRFWPGEDTKLCHDLTYKLGKKIVYHPDVLVFHHRRDIFIPHLKQIGRYGLHRGFFVKILPKTSKRLGYFMPMLFAVGVIFGPIAGLIFPPLFVIYALVLGVYFLFLVLTQIWVLRKSRNILIALLVGPTIFVSHIFYGLMFAQGLTKKVFKSKYGRDKL